jgi:flagellar protein FliO/FliZ
MIPIEAPHREIRGGLMDTLFGEGQSGLVLFVIGVLGLLAVAFWLLRRFGGERLGGGATRGRQSRLAVIDQATVDSRRRLVLIRRDNVEHLLIIGGPSDVVVEQNILRAATAPPKKGLARPPAMPRVGEDSTWSLQPELAPPGAPAPRKARTADPLAKLADALSRVPAVGEPAELRRPPRLQSTADAALKPATAAMAQPPALRKARKADPLAELADDFSAEQRRPPRLQPAPPAGSTADATLKQATDQNLSEIAQQLEATLRRAAKSSDDARTAAGNPKTTGEQAAPSSPWLDTMLRRPFSVDEPRAPLEAPKAPSEPAAAPREPETLGRGDEVPAAPPPEPDTQGRGDDKAAREPATPPREPDTQGRDDDKVARKPAVPPREQDTQGRGDDGSGTNDRPWRLADLSFVPSGNGRETATINGVEVMKENGRYWIITPNGPLWSNIDERGVDPALNYLFEKQRQER